LILCEEDRRQLKRSPWHSGYRWFRSPNIIPLEQWRHADAEPAKQKAG
jgi:hypothetical protein